MKTWLCAALLASLASPARTENAPVVIAAGTLLDGRGGVSRDVWIRIQDGRIESVRTAPKRASARAEGVTYDLTAFTVLPGLVDAHAHLVWHFNAKGKLH